VNLEDTPLYSIREQPPITTAWVETFGGSWHRVPVDYYKLTGNAPTVFNANYDTIGNNGTTQHDAFFVELTSSTKKK
jgi:hypothetical protein